jgi:hypothetical protein
MKLVPIFVAIAVALFPMSAIGDMAEENGNNLLSAKGSGWWMQFPMSDFKKQLEKHTPDGRSDYYMFSNNKSKLNISFYIEQTKNCSNSTECRDKFWSNPGPLVKNPQNVRKYDQNGFSIVEYYLPDLKYKEFTVDQMNVSGHIVRDGYWVDMHISKVLYKDSDRESFNQVINSISFKQR